MKSKLVRIVLNIVTSVIVFVITAILLSEAGGAIFGTDKNGYGKYNAGVFYAIVFLITIIFAIWFSKFLAKKGAEENVAE